MDPAFTEAFFGADSKIDIYGGEFRHIKGDYVEHEHVDEIAISNSGNITNVKINELREGKGKVDRENGEESQSDSAMSDNSEEEEDELAQAAGTHAQGSSTFAQGIPPPIGLTRLQGNLYEALMMSAADDFQRHQDKFPKQSETSFTGQVPAYDGVQVAQALNGMAATLLGRNVASSSTSISITAGRPSYLPAFATQEVIEGVVTERIVESSTINFNTGRVSNASVKKTRSKKAFQKS